MEVGAGRISGILDPGLVVARSLGRVLGGGGDRGAGHGQCAGGDPRSVRGARCGSGADCPKFCGELKMKSRLAILLTLVVVFVAGAAAGGAYGWREGFRKAMRRPRPDDMQKHVVDGLQKDLALTAAQREKIEPIVAETTTKIGELHRNTGQQMRELIKAQNARFKDFLEPGQWDKLQELEKQRWRRRSGDTNRPSPPSPH